MSSQRNVKRVCIIDYDMTMIGGVEQVTSNLANSLSDYCEIYVVSLCSSMNADGLPAYHFNGNVNYSNFNLRAAHIREMLIYVRKPLLNFISTNKIDIVLFQGHWTAFICSAALGLRPPVKTIFSDHGALKNQWDDKKTTFMRLTASILCSKVIVLTKRSMDDYQKAFPWVRKKIQYLYNWIECSAEFGEYDKSSKRIMSAGRFGKEKGFDLLVKAYAPLVQRHPDWHLDIYGDGETMPQIRQMIRENHLENNIHLMGMCENLMAKYKEYAIYVLPSYREGLPLVLLEAKANGLPIISFDICTGPSEIVEDGINGILVPPYDLQAFAGEIERLIVDDELRVYMASRAREGLDRFSKERVLNQWFDLIETL